MAECKKCVSEKVCRYNDGHNLYCKEDYECPNFKNKDDVVEVRHGKWETKEALSEPGEPQKYSHFHKECKYYYVDYGVGGHYYCPLCGAKMDGKGDANE